MRVDTEAQNGESDEEGEVDLKVELISALEELEKCRRKNKSRTISLASWKLKLQRPKGLKRT